MRKFTIIFCYYRLFPGKSVNLRRKLFYLTFFLLKHKLAITYYYDNEMATAHIFAAVGQRR